MGVAKKSRAKQSMIVALPPAEATRRYSTDVAQAYLDLSHGTFWKQVKTGDIRVIKEGSRTFVPGSEILRKVSLPVQA